MSDSNIFSDNTEINIDFREIEQRAREMRSDALRHAVKTTRNWLRRTFTFPSVDGHAPA